MILSGRSAIITGASHGLGKAIAWAYTKAGANVFLCARNESVLAEAKKELAEVASASQLVLALSADVAKFEDCNRLVKAAISALK